MSVCAWINIVMSVCAVALTQFELEVSALFELNIENIYFVFKLSQNDENKIWFGPIYVVWYGFM
jgi:hypothetical protein